jgi:hypothetical protein
MRLDSKMNVNAFNMESIRMVLSSEQLDNRRDGIGKSGADDVNASGEKKHRFAEAARCFTAFPAGDRTSRLSAWSQHQNGIESNQDASDNKEPHLVS